jgi:putative DNA primase/helicase
MTINGIHTETPGPQPPPLLEPDRELLQAFIDAVFKHATTGFFSVRSFYEGTQEKLRLEAVPVSSGLKYLGDVCEDIARRAANAGKPAVFCPIIATFKNGEKATEADLVEGFTITAECDKQPRQALAALVRLLGQPTALIKSGGEWIDPHSGLVEDKLHAHWRLSKPARTPEELAQLKAARAYAVQLVGADPTSIPVVHPIRFTGSWHRKAAPKMCQTEELNPEREVSLGIALAALKQAASQGQQQANGKEHSAGGAADEDAYADLIRKMLSGESYHEPLTRLAMLMMWEGTSDIGIINILRGFMQNVFAQHDRRWQDRYDRDIEHAVATARGKIGGDQAEWPDPKPLPEGLAPVDAFDPAFLPDALALYVEDVATRLQCPADYVAVAIMTAFGAVVGRRIGIKPQVKTDWIEVPNLWGMFVGRPGMLKSPAMSEALRFTHHLEGEAQKEYEVARKAYEAGLNAYKLKEAVAKSLTKERLRKNPDAEPDSFELGDEPQEPKAVRFRTNDTSYEKLGEILIDNPAGLLIERDELVSLLSHLDHEEQAVARGFYLSGWSGQQPYTFDRIARGHKHIDAVCLSVLGNTQPSRIVPYVAKANAGGTGGDGLLQRFGLMAWPDVSSEWRNVDEYPAGQAREQAWQLFERASKIDRTAALKMGAELGAYDKLPSLRFTLDAAEEFLAWRSDLEVRLRSGGIPPALEGHLSKYRKLVPSLALLNHLADRRPLDIEGVSREALRQALAYAKYLESHARRLYAAGREGERAAAKAILRKIRSGVLRNGFTARDIHQNDWAHLTDHDAVAAGLSLLVDLDHIRPSSPLRERRSGRPKTIYAINPKTLAGGAKI